MASLNVYILTFNCARQRVQPHQLGPHIFDALPQGVSLPDILVFSLQEVAPIAYAFLGGSFLTPYFSALRDAVRSAAKDYVNIITRNVGLTAIMIFAKDASYLSTLETAGVGVGLQEMGNKGAVGVRLKYEETQLTFVAAHLAPMEDELQRRNEDWEHIVKGLVFTREDEAKRDERAEDVPLLQGFSEGDSSGPGMYSPKSHLFVAGDLNYRVSELRPTANDYRTFPQPTDPRESPNNFLNLFKSDQLRQELDRKTTMHGLSEAPIEFPPTYKYSANKNDGQWNWARHRWPSWCDRVLYLNSPTWMQEKIKITKYDALPQQDTSDHLPVALSLSVPLQPIPNPADDQDDIRLHPPFEINPDWKSRRSAARKIEIAVGLAAYLSLTWEGNGLLLATLIGGIGGYLIIRSLLAV
jgi:endonuclease/exonuclease/phosphatase family metal-dependent hydrolase